MISTGQLNSPKKLEGKINGVFIPNYIILMTQAEYDAAYAANKLISDQWYGVINNAV